MRAGFHLSCQKLTLVFYPRNDALKKIFQPISCLSFWLILDFIILSSSNWPSGPQVCFKRFSCKNDQKWSKNGHFWNISLWFFFLPKLKNKLVKNSCNLCHRFWFNWDLDMFTSSKWPSEPKFCERYLCSWQKNGQKLL